jgi:DHA1 family bicyclomycin/chloramphenicol resistance-like MFS transporter
MSKNNPEGPPSVAMIGGVMLGALTSGHLAGRRSTARTIGLGYAIMAVAISLNVGICALLPQKPLWNVAPIMIFTIGASLVTPPFGRRELAGRRRVDRLGHP